MKIQIYQYQTQMLTCTNPTDFGVKKDTMYLI